MCWCPALVIKSSLRNSLALVHLRERVAEAVSAVEERHEQQLEILSKSIKRRYVKKRFHRDSDEEFEGGLKKFRNQREMEKLEKKVFEYSINALSCTVC